MTEGLQDKELTDIKYLRARMTGNVGLALDHAYNLGFFDGEKNVAEKIRAEINSPNRGTCDYFIVDRIEEIIDKYKSSPTGGEGSE